MRRVYKIENDHWVTFNSAAVPNKPPSRTFRVYYPEHCWTQPQWFHHNHPFMGFAPSEPFFSGPIFGRLAGTIYSFKIKEVREGKWALDRATQESWHRLEYTLTQICKFFFARSGATFAHTLDIQAFRQPSRWGYRKEHESMKAARIRVMNSRNAFVPLMALCVYAFASNKTCAPFDTEALVHVLIHEARVNSEWANALAQSQLLSTTQFRVGVYVDQDVLLHNLLRPMIAFNVPIWIRVTSTIPNPHDHSLIRISEEDLLRTARRDKQAELSIATPAQTESTATLNLAGARTKVRNSEVATRQHYGETIDQFFEREAKYREYILNTETGHERDVRQSKERGAQAYICPGHHGAHIFEWIEESGNLKRCHVPRKDASTIWQKYAIEQKRYNSVRNEWDLCKEFAPDATTTSAIYADDNDIDLQFEAELHEAPESGPDAQQATNVDLTSQFAPFVAAADEQSPRNPLISLHPLSYALYYKYGFQPDGTTVTELSDIPMSRRYPLDKSLKILGERRDGTLSDSDADNLTCFIWAYATSQPIPSGLWDLDETNSHLLRTHYNRQYVVTLDGDNICRVRSTSPDTQIELFVPKPSMAVEALRQATLESLSDLALYYVTRGTPFTWRAIGTSSSFPVFQPPPGNTEGLGFRAVNYVTTYYDYQSYIRRRNTLLRDRGIARAALQQGGIVWRLTVDALSEMHQNFDFQGILEEDLEAVSLSQEDLGVICGMYKKWTGKSSSHYTGKY